MAKIITYSVVDGGVLAEQYRERELNYPKFFKMDNLCKLGYLACFDLLGGTKFGDNGLDVAMVMCCRYSSIDSDIEFTKTIVDKSNFFPSPSVFVYTLPNIVLGELAIGFGIRGESCCYVVDCVERADFSIKVEQIFAHTSAMRVICCWLDYFDEPNRAVMVMVERNGEGVEFSDNKFIKLYDDGKID